FNRPIVADGASFDGGSHARAFGVNAFDGLLPERIALARTACHHLVYKYPVAGGWPSDSNLRLNPSHIQRTRTRSTYAVLECLLSSTSTDIKANLAAHSQWQLAPGLRLRVEGIAGVGYGVPDGNLIG